MIQEVGGCGQKQYVGSSFELGNIKLLLYRTSTEKCACQDKNTWRKCDFLPFDRRSKYFLWSRNNLLKAILDIIHIT